MTQFWICMTFRYLWKKLNWRLPGAMNDVEQKDRCYNKYRKDHCEENWNPFKAAKNWYNRVICNANAAK